MKIAVTGATGFVGRNLITHLLENTNHDIVAISRNKIESFHPRLSNIQADIYSLLEAEEALDSCDIAFYLIHSMAPVAKLSQGNFKDFDFILADNFARAAQKKKLKKVIYIGGLIPNSKKLSEHLSSRLEVEKLLSYRLENFISLRCGLVLGKGGSSFSILEKLLSRLPILILPKWMNSKLQIVAINDLMKVCISAIEDKTNGKQIVDTVNSEVYTYKKVLFELMKQKRIKKPILSFPYIPPFLSSLWISLISSTSKRLVGPLLRSLCSDSLVSFNENKIPKAWNMEFKNLQEAIIETIDTNNKKELFKIHFDDAAYATEVKSVQRLPLPINRDAKWVAKYYMIWLPSLFRLGLKVVEEDNICMFKLIFIDKPLLILNFNQERSTDDRPLFYIVGGLLVDFHKKGRLEFRDDPDGKFTIAAIQGFRPALPWYVYRYTQALAHKITMNLFGIYLSKR